MELKKENNFYTLSLSLLDKNERNYFKILKKNELINNHIKYNEKTLNFEFENINEIEKLLQIKLKKEKIDNFDFLIKIDNNYTQINDINDILPNNDIDELTSFEVPNAQFSQKYVNGLWDGKIHLSYPNEYGIKIPTGLLPNIIKLFDIENYTYKIIEKKSPIKQFNWKINEKINLRPYQEEAKKEAIKNEKCIIQIPTGGGKTIIACNIIQELGLKTIFCVHTKDLLYQAYNKMKEVIPNARIGIIGDGKKEIEDITIATVQSLYRLKNKNKLYEDYKKTLDTEDLILLKNEKETELTEEEVTKLFNETEVLIQDECQFTPSNTFYSVIMKFKNAFYKIGLSATPYREDGMEMKMYAALGNIVFNLTTRELIEKGFLVEPIIKIIKLPQKSNIGASFQKIYKNYIVENQYRNNRVIKLIEDEEKKNKNILIIVKHIKHLNILRNLYNEKNENKIEFITGKKSGKRREEILNKFRNGEIKTLLATTVADVGLDLPSINVLVLCGSGKSKIKVIQRIGRALRLSPGKNRTEIYDFIDKAKYLFEHFLERKEVYKREENKFEIKFID